MVSTKPLNQHSGTLNFQASSLRFSSFSHMYTRSGNAPVMHTRAQDLIHASGLHVAVSMQGTQTFRINHVNDRMFFSLPATAPAPVLSGYSRYNDGRFPILLVCPYFVCGLMAEPPEKANYDRNNHAELVPGKTPDRSRYDTNKVYKQQRFRHAHRYEIGCNSQGAGIDVFREFGPWEVAVQPRRFLCYPTKIS